MSTSEQKVSHWTPEVWLHLIDAVERYDNQSVRKRGGKWEAVARTLPPNVLSKFLSDENTLQNRYYSLRCDVNNKKKPARCTRGITKEVLQKMEDFLRRTESYQSRKRGKVDRVVDCDAFQTFSTTGGTCQEICVDQPEGFPADVEENSKMAAAQPDGGLDSGKDSQSFQTAPQSFLNEDPSDFESFFGQYDLVLNQIFCPMNIQNLIQNGKNRLREKMKQEFGNQRCMALLEPSSWSKSRASRDANFIPLQIRITREMESGTDALFDKVAKGLAIEELQRKEDL